MALILPDFMLPIRANAQWDYSGMDDPVHCLDRKHFKRYAYPVQYNFSSRGYRDAEWPLSLEELRDAIWCVGDSFTMGLGSPLAHTWPSVLQQRTGRRCINVSLDGASNNWISRKTCSILNTIAPRDLVIHWSYWHRREASVQQVRDCKVCRVWKDFYNGIKDPTWPSCNTFEQMQHLPAHIKQEIIEQHWIEPEITDEDLIFYNTDEQIQFGTLVIDDDENLKNTKLCIDRTITSNRNTNIIHSFIPEFTQTDAVCSKSESVAKLKQLVNDITEEINFVPYFDKLDLARDGHHYDLKTAEYFVQQLLVKL
jgi:hypothetical protein